MEFCRIKIRNLLDMETFLADGGLVVLPSALGLRFCKAAKFHYVLQLVTPLILGR